MNKRRLTFGLLLLLFVSTLGLSSTTHSFSITLDQSTDTMIPSQVDTPIEIGSNAELAQLSTAGVGTRNNPYIIEGITITGSNCVNIHDTTSSFILRNSQFVFDYPRIGIQSSVIRLDHVEDGVIENCYVRGGDIAIELVVTTNILISNCITFDAYRGILLDSSSNCTVIDTACYSNSIGAMIVNSNDCNIINNSIYGNYQRGVHVEVFSEDNTIFGNSIGWNTVQNAMDSGENTEFTNGIDIGNEWSDYNSSEEYSIDGSSGSTDPYATLLTDVTAPAVSMEPDFVIDIEGNGEAITWTVSDAFPQHYQIYVDDELVENNAWDGLEITFSLDYLIEGTHIINLTVTDGAGNAGRDEVVVSVISFILGGIGTELVMYASGITMVCFVVIILLIKRFA